MNEKDMDNIQESSSDSDSSYNEYGYSNENLTLIYESFPYMSLEEQTNSCDEQISLSCSTEREHLFKNDTSNEKSSPCTSILDEQINLRSNCSEDVTNSHLSENYFCLQRSPTRLSDSKSANVRGRSHRKPTRNQEARQYSPVTTVAPYNAASFNSYYPPIYAPYYQGVSVPCSRNLQCCCSFAESCCHSFTNRCCHGLAGSSCNSFIESCCASACSRSSGGHCCRSSGGHCCRSSGGHCCRSSGGACCLSFVGACCRSSVGACCRSSVGACCHSSVGVCCRSSGGPYTLVDGRAVFYQPQQIPSYQTVVPPNRKVRFQRPRGISLSRSRAYWRPETNINSRRRVVLFPRRRRGRNSLPRGNGRLTNNFGNRALSENLEVAGSSRNLNLVTRLVPINEELGQSRYSRQELNRITENMNLNSSNMDSLERSQMSVASANSRDCISSENNESLYKCKYSEDSIVLSGSSFKVEDYSYLENKRNSLYQNSDSDNCAHTHFANTENNILNFSDGKNELTRNHESSENRSVKISNFEFSPENIHSEKTNSVIYTDIYFTAQESSPEDNNDYRDIDTDTYSTAQDSLPQQPDIYLEAQTKLPQQNSGHSIVDTDINPIAEESLPQQKSGHSIVDTDINPTAQASLPQQNSGHSIVDTDINPTAEESLPQQISGSYNETSDGSFGLLMRDLQEKCRKLMDLIHSWRSVDFHGHVTEWIVSESTSYSYSSCETFVSFFAENGAIDSLLKSRYIVNERTDNCQGQTIAPNSSVRCESEADAYLALPISIVQEFCKNLYLKCKLIAVKDIESPKESELLSTEESDYLSDIDSMRMQIQNIERIVKQLRKWCEEYYDDIKSIISKGFISASLHEYWTFWMNELLNTLQILDDFADLYLLISRKLNL